jgi:hypothetical protein
MRHCKESPGFTFEDPLDFSFRVENGSNASIQILIVYD